MLIKSFMTGSEVITHKAVTSLLENNMEYPIVDINIHSPNYAFSKGLLRVVLVYQNGQSKEVFIHKEYLDSLASIVERWSVTDPRK